MSGQAKKRCNPYPSPCLPNRECDVPFIVCPKAKQWNLHLGGCDDSCPCPPVDGCSLHFLCEDGEYDECPDTSRTCTRRDPCPPPCPPHHTPDCPPAAAAPAPAKKVLAQPAKPDYRKVVGERAPLPGSTTVKAKSKASSGEVRTFSVTLVDKEKHPQRDRIEEGQKVWAINGHAGARINLPRNSVCYFDVKQDIVDGKKPQVFYFTTDIAGPTKSINGEISPLPGTNTVTNGIVSLKIDSHTPGTFYYQSDSGAYRGGMIVVHDSK